MSVLDDHAWLFCLCLKKTRLWSAYRSFFFKVQSLLLFVNCIIKSKEQHVGIG